MILTDLFATILRLAELVFAAIVAGLNGEFLHDVHDTVSDRALAPYIYAEVVAGLSMFLALIWLLPFAGSFIHYPIDFFISLCWFAAFGVLVHYNNGACGRIFYWGDITLRGDDFCGKRKAVIAFAFLSAICWLVSSIIGAIWVRDHETRTYRRRGWGRGRV